MSSYPQFKSLNCFGGKSGVRCPGLSPPQEISGNSRPYLKRLLNTIIPNRALDFLNPFLSMILWRSQEYAMKSGFLEEWRRTSRQRFKESEMEMWGNLSLCADHLKAYIWMLAAPNVWCIYKSGSINFFVWALFYILSMVVNNIHLLSFTYLKTRTCTHTHTPLHSALLQNACKNIYLYKMKWRTQDKMISASTVSFSRVLLLLWKFISGMGKFTAGIGKWVFPKKGYPQIIHFNRVFHYKPSILGYPYFWKHPNFPPRQEVLCFLLVMLSCRWLAFASNRIWDLETQERPEISGCFMAKKAETTL